MSILRPGLQTRFQSTFQVIEGGSGTVYGVITDVPQGTVPANVFTAPRSALRTSYPTALKAGMVLQTTAGNVFLVGDNGPEQYGDQFMFYSWRLYPATKQVDWQRRQKVIDNVTGLSRDIGVEDLGQIWVVMESLDRETLDRKTHTPFESWHFVTGQAVQEGDILDGKTVNRSDLQLGVWLGVLT